MDQYEQIQAYNKKIFSGVALKLAIAFFLILAIAAVTGLGWYYKDLDERKISFEDARKIGNWEFVDSNYVFQGAFRLKMFGDIANSVEIMDEKSGNEINILEISRSFSDAHLKFDSEKSEDEKSNDELFVEFYVPDNYAIRATGKIEDGRAEINYNRIENKGYENLNDKIEGILGKIDCGGKIIIILVRNKAGKFDYERALSFARTLACDGGSAKDDFLVEKSTNLPKGSAQKNGAGIKNDYVPKEKSDIPLANMESESSQENLPGKSVKTGSIESEGDSQKGGLSKERENYARQEDSDGDGLSNNIELLVGSDSNKTDSDLDGFSDFDEIRHGFDPAKRSPGDAFLPSSYEKLKSKIKLMDEENYNRLFL